MNTRIQNFGKWMAAAAIICSLTIVGCKKREDNNVAAQNMVGIWGHVAQNSTFRNTVTYKTLNSDGSGNESIYSVTTGSSTQISDLDFSWNTEKDSILNLNFTDGTKDRYTYILDANQTKLALTTESGAVREYYK